MTKQYQALLLRLQRSEGQSGWRAIIENVNTGERIRFADQNQMLHYLFDKLSDNAANGNEIKKLLMKESLSSRVRNMEIDNELSENIRFNPPRKITTPKGESEDGS